jgi:hypothetical protein
MVLKLYSVTGLGTFNLSYGDSSVEHKIPVRRFSLAFASLAVSSEAFTDRSVKFGTYTDYAHTYNLYCVRNSIWKFSVTNMATIRNSELTHNEFHVGYTSYRICTFLPHKRKQMNNNNHTDTRTYTTRILHNREQCCMTSPPNSMLICVHKHKVGAECRVVETVQFNYMHYFHGPPQKWTICTLTILFTWHCLTVYCLVVTTCMYHLWHYVTQHLFTTFVWYNKQRQFSCIAMCESPS